MVYRDSSAQHRGFTLVELLVVMGVIVLLAAVTLPTLKGVLSGQKVAQASQIVRTYVESAKSRAIATGRPVAVILDRLRYDGLGTASTADTCVRISVGDVFPPYTGDWSGATGVLADANGDSFVDTITIPLAMAASLWDVPNDRPAMVKAGDIIELGTRREQFDILPLGPGLPAVEFLPPSSGLPARVAVRFRNPPSVDVGGVLIATGEAQAGLPAGAARTFRIYRKPTKSLAGGVTLPRGTCVDLSASGFGIAGTELSSATVLSTTPPGNTDVNSSFGPIYLIFNPDGSMQNWYRQDRSISVVEPSDQRQTSTGLLHLLIGATDQVPGTTLTADTFTEDVKSNLTDDGNIWVTVNPFNGAVTTSQVQSVLTTPVVLPARIAEARLLATNQLQSQDAIE